MPLLLLVSLIWAFSFGLIKDRLAGLDPTALGVTRIALSAAVFLPALRLRKIPAFAVPRLMAIGAVEFGIMYLAYMAAFRHLAAHEVALFTIFTPLWLALLEAAAARRFAPRLAAAVLLAIAGAAVVCWRGFSTPGLAAGFVLVQVSNAAFAAGQFWYRRIRAALPPVPDSAVFGLLYLGALAVTAAASVFTTDWGAFRPAPVQWLTLVYLGAVASGLCFFWWNLGATRVKLGTLAVFNNAKIPLGVAVALLFFGESAHLPRLLAGGALLVLAIMVAERKQSHAP
ncbi:MAG: EamA family transporter [Opitutaceae bacterium]|jgi:drug/metabolite transporter (DMT)-like permease|nr:EamA family transporter [Opitutaceae bacterium]